MSDYDNTNRGVLFKNKRKEQGDKKPEYTGSLNVNGTEFFLDAWLKTSQSGEKFMSVSVKQKDKQSETKPAQKAAPANSGFDDLDDVPF